VWGSALICVASSIWAHKFCVVTRRGCARVSAAQIYGHFAPHKSQQTQIKGPSSKLNSRNECNCINLHSINSRFSESLQMAESDNNRHITRSVTVHARSWFLAAATDTLTYISSEKPTGGGDDSFGDSSGPHHLATTFHSSVKCKTNNWNWNWCLHLKLFVLRSLMKNREIGKNIIMVHDTDKHFNEPIIWGPDNVMMPLMTWNISQVDKCVKHQSISWKNRCNFWQWLTTNRTVFIKLLSA